MKHSRCPTSSNAVIPLDMQTLASQTSNTSSYHHSPSKSGVQNPFSPSAESRPVLTGWSNSAETVQPAGVCPPLTGLGIRYIEPTLVKTSNSVQDFQAAGEPQLSHYDSFCASDLSVPYSEVFNPCMDSSFQRKNNEVSISSYPEPSSFQSAVEASWSFTSHADSDAQSSFMQEGPQRYGLGLQYPIFDWSMASDSAVSGSSASADASSFLAGLDIQYQSFGSDMDISCSDMSISSASSTTGDDLFADFLNDEASGWPELQYPEARIDTPMMAAPILDINMYDTALSEQDFPVSLGVNPADTVGSETESTISVPEVQAEPDFPLRVLQEDYPALSYPEGIKSELQTILDVLVSANNTDESQDVVEPMVNAPLEADAQMHIVAPTPRPCQMFVHYDLLPPPAQYEGTYGTNLPLLRAPPSPSPSPCSQPQTLLPVPPLEDRTPDYPGQLIMKIEPPAVTRLVSSDYVAGSTVLDAHHGIQLEELELRAAEYRRENPGQDINKKWLLSFAGKLSERGELLDEFRCYVVGCNQRNKRRDHILIHVGAHVDQRPFQCPFW